MSAFSRRLAQRLHQFEDGLLALLLITMILLACAQILLRNAGGGSLLWADPTGRILLLWLGFLGALAAARKNRHIAIDIIGHYLPEKLKGMLARGVAIVTAIMCSLLAWHTARFVLFEWEAPTALVLGIPSWVPPLIIPLSFALMALRYAIHSAFGTETQEPAA